MPVVSLVVFTRYPRSGQTKTRLIPLLGADGAALVQRLMTEQVVATARQFARLPGRRLKVCATGAAFRDLGLWLGFDLDYCDQGDGDLGQRLARAVSTALACGAASVIVVGADCPDLSLAYLERAEKALAAGVDLVLGPALDGGYYLIGMSKFDSSLFTDIPWGTAKVLSATLKVAGRAGWQVRQLPPLADIDRPEDLEIWRKEAVPRLSIVIPVLNEADNLPFTLKRLRLAQFRGIVEVIVVDGGSTDDSLLVAERAGCRVLSCAAGRGRQMNAGARAARGRYLLFLHADTLLPPDYLPLICCCLSRPGVAAGAFSLALADGRSSFRLLEKFISWRSRLLGWPYGDQAFFLERSRFEQVGGFWEEELLEDVELLRKIRREGRVVVLSSVVVTSARRWLQLGIFWTTLINQLVMSGYFLGLPPEYLARLYRAAPFCRRLNIFPGD
ncbi:MAG: TIGR04283 family arsenosugar biosynthesis glycosyltransferase [Deltaproteobacteria bacterium]|nr:TIGR04283 family arsenosugar biosynthesis glycosyltransferase [Deltaproteobacteria bacterium]